MISEEFKPMNPGQLLDKSFRLSMSSLRSYLKFHILFFFTFVVSIVLLYIFILWVGSNDTVNSYMSSISQEMSDGIALVTALLFILALLMLNPVFVIWFAMMVDMLGKSFLKQKWYLKRSITLAFRKYFHTTLFLVILLPALSSSHIINVLFQFGENLKFTALLFLINWLLLIPVTLFINAIPATTHENLSLIKAVKRSLKLASYNYPLLFLKVSFFSLISLAINVALSPFLYIRLSYIINFTGFDKIAAIMMLITLLCSIIVYPFTYLFTSAFHTLLYYNQRIKHEDYGVEKMVEAFINENNTLTEEGLLTND